MGVKTKKIQPQGPNKITILIEGPLDDCYYDEMYFR